MAPLVRASVVRLSAAVMRNGTVVLAVLPLASVTVSSTVKSPVASVVPLMVPSAAMVRPVGNPVAFQV